MPENWGRVAADAVSRDRAWSFGEESSAAIFVESRKDK
jgi:hypothetical protein